ncbi:MAG: alpha/beta hydrolase [Actinomycetes bacterium]
MSKRDQTAPPLVGSMKAEAAAGRMLASLSPRLQVRMSGGNPTVIDGQRLDPACQLVLSLIERRGLADEFGSVGRERAIITRQSVIAGGNPDPVSEVRNLRIAGGDGEIGARFYKTIERGGPHPLLVWYHGGGFVIGSLDSHDSICRALCFHAGVDVLSVDYRLAPEHQFPAGVDDARAAFTWAVENAADLGSDPTRVLVGGDSAGGNLAAVTALSTAKSLTPPPFAQLLVYPITDMVGRIEGSGEKTRSYQLFGEGFLLTTKLMDWFGQHYVEAESVDPADPRVSPLRADDLSGLPPAIVITAGFDPLRDEGEAYADALRAAGGTAVTRRFPELIHGFANMAGVSHCAREAIVEIAGTLRAVSRA